MEKPGLGSQILRGLLYGRFEPIETILSAFLIIKGLWVTIRTGVYNDPGFLFSSGAPFRIIAIFFIIFGVVHMISMYHTPFRHSRTRWWRYRCNSLFGISIVLFFATLEVALVTPVGETRFLNWLALTFISAATYLSLVVKR